MAERINTPEFHDSAELHVKGRATYVDDIPVPSTCLHICLLYTSPSPRDRG